MEFSKKEEDISQISKPHTWVLASQRAVGDHNYFPVYLYVLTSLIKIRTHVNN